MNELDSDVQNSTGYDFNAAIADLRRDLDADAEIPPASENRTEIGRELYRESIRLDKLAREADNARTRERIKLLGVLCNVEANRADLLEKDRSKAASGDATPEVEA